jgi:single-strand DNA-binding protein
MNQYTCIGRLGADPRLRGQDGPTPVCRFRLAVDQLKRDGEDAEALWFTVTVFGRQALACARFLKQGRQVAVTGRLQPDRWTAKDGTAREHVQIVAHNVEFLFAAPPAGEHPEPDGTSDEHDEEPVNLPDRTRARRAPTAPRAPHDPGAASTPLAAPTPPLPHPASPKDAMPGRSPPALAAASAALAAFPTAAHADRACGNVRLHDGATVHVRVLHGAATCPTARAIARRYLNSTGPCTGSSCVRPVRDWTCQTAGLHVFPRLASCVKATRWIAAYSLAH